MTVQSWKFGSTSLTSFGVVTQLDDSIDFASSRGDDIEIPFFHGKRFVKKFFDSRKIAFGIALSDSTAAALQTKLDNLRKLLAVRTEQILEFTLDDGTVRNAYASCNESISPQFESPLIARIVVIFTLSRPFFRLSTAIADNTLTIDASPKAMAVTNPGTIAEFDPTIILTGPLLNTVITNSTTGEVLTYTGTIASPRVVTISTINGEFAATDDLGANVIGNVTHSGSPLLMSFNPGANSLSITDGTATTGTVKISFYAPFM